MYTDIYMYIYAYVHTYLFINIYIYILQILKYIHIYLYMYIYLYLDSVYVFSSCFITYTYEKSHLLSGISHKCKWDFSYC